MVRLLTIMMLIVTTITSAQSLHYNNKGNVDGIILTIEEATKVDNDYELLGLYKSLNMEYEGLETLYISLIDGYKQEITSFEFKTNLLESQLKDMNTINDKLTEQNQLHIKNSILYEEEIKIKDDAIKSLNKSLNKQKKNKWFLFGVALIGGSILYFTK